MASDLMMDISRTNSGRDLEALARLNEGRRLKGSESVKGKFLCYDQPNDLSNRLPFTSQISRVGTELNKFVFRREPFIDENEKRSIDVPERSLAKKCSVLHSGYPADFVGSIKGLQPLAIRPDEPVNLSSHNFLSLKKPFLSTFPANQDLNLIHPVSSFDEDQATRMTLKGFN